jgi:hypothetical protein
MDASAPVVGKVISSAVRPANVRLLDRQRSRVTNGSALLPGVDGRSAWVRRARDVIAEIVADLGGIENTSAQERSIVRRAATLVVELERLEKKFALADAASPDDLDLYARASGNLRRLLEAIGLRRRPREVSAPSLSDYLAAAESKPDVDADAGSFVQDEADT